MIEEEFQCRTCLQFKKIACKKIGKNGKPQCPKCFEFAGKFNTTKTLKNGKTITGEQLSKGRRNVKMKPKSINNMIEHVIRASD